MVQLFMQWRIPSTCWLIWDFQYGKGFSEFDEVINELADEARELPVDKNHVLRHLSHIVVVPFLLRAGFRDEWVKEFTIKRICLIHDFVTLNQYDIYDDILKYKKHTQML